MHENEMRMAPASTGTTLSEETPLKDLIGRHSSTTPERPVVRLMLTPEEVAMSLGFSRTRVFALLRAGTIASAKVGKTRVVPVSAVEAYVASLMA